MEDILKDILMKITDYRAYFMKNESAVSMQIVEPILRVLNWDTFNPSEVQPQTHSLKGIPDYTLLLNGRKIGFIEVKKLDVTIDDSMLEQLERYCSNDEKKFGLFTNGIEWILLKPSNKTAPLSEKIDWRINLENDDIRVFSDTLKTIAKENISNYDFGVDELKLTEVSYYYSGIFEDMVNEIFRSTHFVNRSSLIFKLFGSAIAEIEREFDNELSFIELYYTKDYIAFKTASRNTKNIFMTIRTKLDYEAEHEVLLVHLQINKPFLREKYRLEKRTQKNKEDESSFEFSTLDDFKVRLPAIRHSFEVVIDR